MLLDPTRKCRGPRGERMLTISSGCSILCPSGAQGLFGMRPTHGAITLEGVMPLQPALDTAGFFARNAVTGRDFSKGWYGDRFENFTSFPTVGHQKATTALIRR